MVTRQTLCKPSWKKALGAVVLRVPARTRAWVPQVSRGPCLPRTSTAPIEAPCLDGRKGRRDQLGCPSQTEPSPAPGEVTEEGGREGRGGEPRGGRASTPQGVRTHPRMTNARAGWGGAASMPSGHAALGRGSSRGNYCWGRPWREGLALQRVGRSQELPGSATSTASPRR